MSIDMLHERIRKLKNPSVIDLSVKKQQIPPHILEEEGCLLKAYDRFCREILQGLKGMVPAVRFSFGAFALLGGEGLSCLQALLQLAGELGYYVLMDGPEILTPWSADRTADAVWQESVYPCDGLIISPYIGTDAVKPFLPFCRDQEKDLFVIVRSPNKSARELQDLLTGSRHVHSAAADMVNRHGESVYGKCGYSRVAGAASAGEANILRTLRGSYNRMFLLVDGVDYPSGNYKNCSYAFDRFGHGAAVCAGPSVTAAWMEGESDAGDYILQAQQAAERMKKNISRYVTVL